MGDRCSVDETINMVFPHPAPPSLCLTAKGKGRLGGEREKGDCHFWSHSATHWQPYLKTPGSNSLLLGTGVSKDVLDCLGSAEARVSHSKGQRPRGQCVCQWGHSVAAGAPETQRPSRQLHNQTSQGMQLPCQLFWGGLRSSHTPLTVETRNISSGVL